MSSTIASVTTNSPTPTEAVLLTTEKLLDAALQTLSTHEARKGDFSIKETLSLLLTMTTASLQISILNSRQLSSLEDSLSQGLAQMSQSFTSVDTALTQLEADVTALTDVENSAIALLNKIPQMIADAVAAAQGAGATPAQLASLSDLANKIEAATPALATAVTANTPAAAP